MIRYFFFLLFMINAINGISQKSDSLFRRQIYAVGISPYALANVYPAIQISQDVAISRRFSASLESGYIFRTQRYNTFNSYRLRGELEFTVIRRETHAFKVGVFYNYRHVNEHETYQIIHPENYKEIVPYILTSDLKGIGFSMGFEINSSKDIVIGIDWGMGQGTIKVVSDVELPENINRPFSFFRMYRRPGVYGNFPIMYINANVSYNLVFHK